MCQNIYISSQSALPVIPWNKNSPGFTVLRVTDPGTLEMLQPILPADFIYEALSFMGCSCGLFSGEGYEDPDQRAKDIRDFAAYLDTHQQENTLQIFSTMWSDFPDQYKRKDFTTASIDPDDFGIEELVILTVSANTH